MIDLFMKLNCNFTKAEKDACKADVYRIINLANLARKEGVLALEREIVHEESYFLKTAILLVADGTDPVLIEQILKAIILADRYTGQQLLSRLIMADGVLMLQQGLNPRIIATKLGAMLGEEYISQIEKESNGHENQMRSYYEFLSKLRGKQPLPECEQFDSRLMQMDNRSVQMVLRETYEAYLFNALYGCGYDLIQKTFNNLSLNSCTSIVKAWDDGKAPNINYILYCQAEITEIISRLEKSGEIIIYFNKNV